MLPRIAVFADGFKNSGGSGFENLVNVSRRKDGALKAEIAGVVSRIDDGLVFDRAWRLGIPFFHYAEPADVAAAMNSIWRMMRTMDAEWAVLSGFRRKLYGLDPQKTINIHPALLSVKKSDGTPRFGGKGMWGDAVHAAVKAARDRGEIEYTGFSMHFVGSGEYDSGPVFYEHAVDISAGMQADRIRALVHRAELEHQPRLVNEVVHGRISWDGKRNSSLINHTKTKESI